MALLTRPDAAYNSWCQVGARSYWVTIREPWTNELDPEDIRNSEDVLRFARIWATASGATHQCQGQSAVIRQRIGAHLEERLYELSGEYLTQLDEDYQRFRSDERVQRLVATADREVARVVPATQPIEHQAKKARQERSRPTWR